MVELIDKNKHIELKEKSSSVEYITPPVIEIDDTLTKQGMASDAKATGDAITASKADWLEMDETQSDFVKNRIGWIEDLGQKVNQMFTPRANMEEFEGWYGKGLFFNIEDVPTDIPDNSPVLFLIKMKSNPPKRVETTYRWDTTEKDAGGSAWVYTDDFDISINYPIYDMDTYDVIKNGFQITFEPYDEINCNNLEWIRVVAQDSCFYDSFKGQKLHSKLIQTANSLAEDESLPLNKNAIKPYIDNSQTIGREDGSFWAGTGGRGGEGFQLLDAEGKIPNDRLQMMRYKNTKEVFEIEGVKGKQVRFRITYKNCFQFKEEIVPETKNGMTLNNMISSGIANRLVIEGVPTLLNEETVFHVESNDRTFKPAGIYSVLHDDEQGFRLKFNIEALGGYWMPPIEKDNTLVPASFRVLSFDVIIKPQNDREKFIYFHPTLVNWDKYNGWVSGYPAYTPEGQKFREYFNIYGKNLFLRTGDCEPSFRKFDDEANPSYDATKTHVSFYLISPVINDIKQTPISFHAMAKYPIKDIKVLKWAHGQVKIFHYKNFEEIKPLADFYQFIVDVEFENPVPISNPKQVVSNIQFEYGEHFTEYEPPFSTEISSTSEGAWVDFQVSRNLDKLHIGETTPTGYALRDNIEIEYPVDLQEGIRQIIEEAQNNV